jgi:glycine/D-amino acid oxidase-like deaminating enzyme
MTAAFSRRSFVLAGAAALPGCATMPAAGPRRIAGCTPLPAVDVREARVIRQVVGLRPYRPSGFVVRREALGTKALVHNYGHGGSGITLSWGSSRLAVDLGLPGHAGPVAVIGAGVMGLTTARLVQDAGFPVTLYTAQLPPETTSNIAGGQWHPAFGYEEGRQSKAWEAQLTAAAGYAYRRFQLDVGDDYGVRWMRNYSMADRPIADDPVDALIAGMLPEARDVAPGEHPFPYRYVRQFDGMIMEPPRLLRALMRDVRIAGGKFVIGRIDTPQQLIDLPETLVFNCTGLGARDLFGDRELTAMRGQLVVLEPQPEVTYALVAPGPTYMFSRADGIILGGTGEPDNFSLVPDPETGRQIIARHKRVFAGFRCA